MKLFCLIFLFALLAPSIQQESESTKYSFLVETTPPHPFAFKGFGKLVDDSIKQKSSQKIADYIGENDLYHASTSEVSDLLSSFLNDNWYIMIPVALALIIIILGLVVVPIIVCCCKCCSCCCFVEDKDRKKYSDTEKWVPFVFVAVFLLLAFLFAIFTAVSSGYVSKSGFTYVHDGFTGLFPKLNSTASKTFDGTKDVVTEAFGSFKDLVVQKLGSINDQLGTISQGLNTIFENTNTPDSCSGDDCIPDTINNIIEQVNSFSSSFVTNADNTLTSIHKTLDDTKFSTCSQLTDIDDEVNKFFNSYNDDYSGYFNAGGNLLIIFPVLFICPIVLILIGFLMKKNKCAVIAMVCIAILILIVGFISILYYTLGIPFNQACTILKIPNNYSNITNSQYANDALEMISNCRQNSDYNILNKLVSMVSSEDDKSFDISSWDGLLKQFKLDSVISDVKNAIAGTSGGSVEDKIEDIKNKFEDFLKKLSLLDLDTYSDVSYDSIRQFYSTHFSSCETDGALVQFVNPSDNEDLLVLSKCFRKCQENDAVNYETIFSEVPYETEERKVWDFLNDKTNDLGIVLQQDNLLSIRNYENNLLALYQESECTEEPCPESFIDMLESITTEGENIYNDFISGTKKFLNCKIAFDITDPVLAQVCEAYFPALSAAGLFGIVLLILALICCILALCFTHRFKEPVTTNETFGDFELQSSIGPKLTFNENENDDKEDDDDPVKPLVTDSRFEKEKPSFGETEDAIVYGDSSEDL